MAQDPDEDRIRRKAHELWEAEGHPHGRDQDHWDQAREIIAIQDSQASTLLPRDTGAEEPVEDRALAESYGDVPNLTDQGDHDLTDVSREPWALEAESIKPMTSKDIMGEAKSPVVDEASQSGKKSAKSAAKLTTKFDNPVKTGKTPAKKKK